MQIGFYYLLDGAVTTIKIADGAVTTAKIADGAVTDAKRTRTPGGIGTTDIADGAITDVKRTRTPGGIGTTDIANAAITPTLLDRSYAQLGASNTFTYVPQAFNGFTDADGLSIVIWTPTDYGAGKPELALNKQGAAGYSFTAYDGTTNDVGTLNFFIGTVAFKYAVTVQNATAAQNPVPKSQADTDYISTAAGSVGTTNLADNAVTTAKITDANVTSAKLASGAALANIANQSITDSLVQLLGRFQLFTASGTFTAPHAGDYLIIAVGGGGGGGAGGGTTAGGSNGGAGGTPGTSGGLAIGTATLTASQNVTITVGSGGVGGAGASGTIGNNGSAGTDTTVGSYVTAVGGAPGIGGYSDLMSNGIGSRGLPGGGLNAAGGGDYQSVNGDGLAGTNATANTGGGGASGGGGGAGTNATAGGAGGNGADGWVLILW